MKHFLLILALFFTPVHSFAEIIGVPFIKEVDQRFDKIDGLKQRKFVYDYSQLGGNSVDDKPLGLVLPANAVITKFMMFINSAFSDSGTGSFRVKCGADILQHYTDMTAFSAGQIFQNQVAYGSMGSTGLLEPPYTDRTGELRIAEECEIEAEVRGDSGYVPLLGGKATYLIEYFEE